MSYARFFSLFREAQKHTSYASFPYDNHAELVADFTNGRTASLRRLTAEERRNIERRMEELANPVEASMQRMRRKVIGILAGRGVINAQGKPDMERIYAWARKYGYLHKELNAYTVAELPMLVSQAEAIMASDLKALNNHG